MKKVVGRVLQPLVHFTDWLSNIIVLFGRDRRTLRFRLVPSSNIIIVLLCSPFVLLAGWARPFVRLELRQLGARLPDWERKIALGRWSPLPGHFR